LRLPDTQGDERGEKFLTAKLKGFEEDESALPERDEGDETVYRVCTLLAYCPWFCVLLAGYDVWICAS